MKQRLTKLSELQASLLIAGLISILVLIGASIGLFFNRPGLLIGAAIGVAVEFFYIWLVSVGSTLSLKEGKTGLFLLTKTSRSVGGGSCERVHQLVQQVFPDQRGAFRLTERVLGFYLFCWRMDW